MALVTVRPDFIEDLPEDWREQIAGAISAGHARVDSDTVIARSNDSDDLMPPFTC